MNLDNRQITILLLPFIIAILTYIFSDAIAQHARYFFPVYEEYADKNLKNKAEIYLQIEAQNESYMKVIKDVENRNKNSQWVSNNVLYNAISKNDSNTDTTTQPAKQLSQDYPLILQMSFPKKDMAIISGKIVKLNNTIHNAKLISIEQRRVLLQFKEKQKWLYMFN
ncbi:hypothetical protein [Candidatus Sulfurimonas baltica]|uniref:Uncharacterized protein n=1 Tax=Candidatus Sulfurimonas baltica TaxID=2740404 RepID=A0A7S7LX96_9BACT|nr:hypothetical protein [Candidatus Sulfurimonas baltica]QOY53061.1 hypothetical protein HUE88_05115 [Candidatus Sulfurimonas baltica]